MGVVPITYGVVPNISLVSVSAIQKHEEIDRCMKSNQLGTEPWSIRRSIWQSRAADPHDSTQSGPCDVAPT